MLLVDVLPAIFLGMDLAEVNYSLLIELELMFVFLFVSGQFDDPVLKTLLL